MTTPATPGTLVNLGCGSTPHPAFVNIDIDPHPGAIAHDLRRGLPLPDNSAELIYHATMLAFFWPEEAQRLMRECHRVLRPGGVLRVATEDLEQMCRRYLDTLESAWNGDPGAARRHEWMVLEMYDSAVSDRPGGRMVEYLTRSGVVDETFILSRIGQQGREILNGVRRMVGAAPTRQGVRERARAAVKQAVLTTLLGRGAVEAVAVGRFRLSGHVARRMHDRVSVRALFLDAGFVDVVVRSPEASACPRWADANLDLTTDGVPARPHVLIMEGIKPA